MTLRDLIRNKRFGNQLPAATATSATNKSDYDESVAKIAVADLEVNDKQAVTVNSQPKGSVPFDKYCWPYSSAMNSGEVTKFIARDERFKVKGISPEVAEITADKLVIRDRDEDDRRICLECTHLHGYSTLRCGNWRRSGISHSREGAFISHDFAIILQRCDGFES
jgi:hypothetical protein